MKAKMMQAIYAYLIKIIDMTQRNNTACRRACQTAVLLSNMEIPACA